MPPKIDFLQRQISRRDRVPAKIDFLQRQISRRDRFSAKRISYKSYKRALSKIYVFSFGMRVHIPFSSSDMV